MEVVAEDAALEAELAPYKAQLEAYAKQARQQRKKRLHKVFSKDRRQAEDEEQQKMLAQSQSGETKECVTKDQPIDNKEEEEDDDDEVDDDEVDDDEDDDDNEDPEDQIEDVEDQEEDATKHSVKDPAAMKPRTADAMANVMAKLLGEEGPKTIGGVVVAPVMSKDTATLKKIQDHRLLQKRRKVKFAVVT